MNAVKTSSGLEAAIGDRRSPSDGIVAAARLLIDARLGERLLCDVYADRPEEGLRIFWELSGDSLLDAIAVLHSAARHSHKE